MQLPDGTRLMHGSAPYDPAKAHAYYVKTRKLKGRKKGSVKPTGKAMMRIDDTFSVEVGGGKKAKLSSQQLAEQKAYASHRVTLITKKLALLHTELRKRMAEAKQKEHDANKPPSASDKANAARESKKFRDKHQTELKSKAKKAANKEKSTNKPKTDTVEGLKKTIEKVQKSLDAAVQRQRALTAATKNG